MDNIAMEAFLQRHTTGLPLDRRVECLQLVTDYFDAGKQGCELSDIALSDIFYAAMLKPTGVSEEENTVEECVRMAKDAQILGTLRNIRIKPKFDSVTGSEKTEAGFVVVAEVEDAQGQFVEVTSERTRLFDQLVHHTELSVS